MFRCPHCGAHLHVFRTICPVCGKPLAANLSEKMVPGHYTEPAGLPTWNTVTKGIAILAMILIIILLIVSLL